ncbi:MAG: histidinol dehydrogenase [Actinobacteria bacterium]|nr:histidinol dehydrogenase [Actinomycetota bacterium]
MPRLDVLDLRDDRSDPTSRLPRPRIDTAAVEGAVRATLAAVQERGDDAVREHTRRFDRVDVTDLRVPDPIIEAASSRLDGAVQDAIDRAIDQVRWFHERARPRDWEDARDGARMGQWYRPISQVGVYVPGGKAVYPSTVVMTVVPAQVAGVAGIALCSPPQADGWPHPAILATAARLGVRAIFRVGGAQAIAAMALGTETIPACDKIVGPGNIYVATAKQQVQAAGLCGIDAVAGPTEIAIIADESADPGLVAADLVAQAEHDELATCLLITTDPGLVDAVEAALETEISGTRHRARVEAAFEGQGTAVVVADIEHAVLVAEAFAPEHLEVHTVEAAAVAARVRYAGTTFIGPDTPVSLGDYAAGPNHTLPTMGTARFSGGLSTSSFLVPVNWVQYDRTALADLASTVERLAATEDLPAHARAVAIRLEGGS